MYIYGHTSTYSYIRVCIVYFLENAYKCNIVIVLNARTLVSSSAKKLKKLMVILPERLWKRKVGRVKRGITDTVFLVRLVHRVVVQSVHTNRCRLLAAVQWQKHSPASGAVRVEKWGHRVERRVARLVCRAAADVEERSYVARDEARDARAHFKYIRPLNKRAFERWTDWTLWDH